MRTPRAWSSVATAGGALTEIVPSSDVSVSPPSTNDPVPSQTASYHPRHRLWCLGRLDSSDQSRSCEGTTRGVFHRIAFPASFSLIEEAFQPHRPGTFTVPDKNECAIATFDGVNRDSHTVSFGHMLVHVPLRGYLSRISSRAHIPAQG